MYVSLIVSTDLWPQRCLLFLICLQWSCLQAVSVPTFVSNRRPAGLHRDEWSCKVYVCHRGHYEGLSRCRLVGSCVLSWRKFLYIGLHVKPRLHAWHSHRQSRSHFAFSSLSDQGEIRLFFIFRNSFFIQNYRFLYLGDQKISWWRICRWRAVNFEIHLWSSGMNCDCIWRPISIQHVQIEPGVNSDLGNGSFWVEIRDAKHVDRSAHLYM